MRKYSFNNNKIYGGPIVEIFGSDDGFTLFFKNGLYIVPNFYCMTVVLTQTILWGKLGLYDSKVTCMNEYSIGNFYTKFFSMHKFRFSYNDVSMHSLVRSMGYNFDSFGISWRQVSWRMLRLRPFYYVFIKIDFLSFWPLRQCWAWEQKPRENLNSSWKSNISQSDLNRDSKMLL